MHLEFQHDQVLRRRRHVWRTEMDGTTSTPGDSLDGLDSCRETDVTKVEQRASFLIRSWIDIAAALHHIHQHNWVHMDVKPENVFLSRSGQTVVLVTIRSLIH